MRIIIAAVLLAAPAVFAADVDPDRWNLADMYPGAAEWKADAAKLESQLRDVAACKGRLGEGAKRFRRARTCTGMHRSGSRDC